jgi:transposase
MHLAPSGAYTRCPLIRGRFTCGRARRPDVRAGADDQRRHDVAFPVSQSSGAPSICVSRRRGNGRDGDRARERTACACRQRRQSQRAAPRIGGTARVIPVPAGVRIWIATGHTDMRRGMRGLALQVQEGLGRDPFAGDVFVFRGRSGSLIKAIWHDGLGLSLYAKRLDRGRFTWPQTVDGVLPLTAAQMGYLLEAIDWRNPQLTWRPTSAG